MTILQLLSFGENGWGLQILSATWMTIILTISSLIVGACFGGLVATAKLSSHKYMQAVGNLYLLIFRSVPELLIIYLFYFGGASVVSAVAHWFGAEGYIDMPPFFVGMLAVGLISGSYQAEVFRGAYLAVSKGEIEAAYSIGMSRSLLFRRILAPQILQRSLPGLGNVMQMSIKDSALISVIGLVELMRASQMAAGSTRQYFTFYIVAGVVYMVLTWICSYLFNKAELRVRKTQYRNPV